MPEPTSSEFQEPRPVQYAETAAAVALKIGLPSAMAGAPDGSEYKALSGTISNLTASTEVIGLGMVANGQTEAGAVVFGLSKFVHLTQEFHATQKLRDSGELQGTQLDAESPFVKGPAKLTYLAAKVIMPSTLSAGVTESENNERYNRIVATAKRLENASLAIGASATIGGREDMLPVAAAGYLIGKGAALSAEAVTRITPKVKEAGSNLINKVKEKWHNLRSSNSGSQALMS